MELISKEELTSQISEYHDRKKKMEIKAACAALEFLKLHEIKPPNPNKNYFIYYSIRGRTCLCVTMDLRNGLLVFRPIEMYDDIGSGAGCSHLMDFNKI